MKLANALYKGFSTIVKYGTVILIIVEIFEFATKKLEPFLQQEKYEAPEIDLTKQSQDV